MLDLLLDLGYCGLFFGSLLSATIIPFAPGVLLVTLLIGGGNPVAVFLLATVGNWLGGMVSYGMGWIGKWEWIERWFKVSSDKLEKQQRKIERFGAPLAFFCWLPFLGDIFAIGLGFYRINPFLVSLWMLVGKGFRFALWFLVFYAFK